MLRDRISQPLRIDSLPVGNGYLALNFCSGKKGDSAFGRGWDRDLDIDLDTIKAWSAKSESLLIATAHGGNSDSTAAIAGNVLGLLDPAAVLRHRRAEIVECAGIIFQMARSYRELSFDPNAAEELFEVYLGG